MERERQTDREGDSENRSCPRNPLFWQVREFPVTGINPTGNELVLYDVISHGPMQPVKQRQILSCGENENITIEGG